MKTIFTPEPTTVTIRLVEGRYVIFDSKGKRRDSKLSQTAAIVTAKRLFPDSKIVGLAIDV